MSDGFDELMRAAANEADRGVDYDAMRASVEKKAADSRRRLHTNVIRYGSIAAVAAVAVVAGTLLLTRGGNAAPKSAESAEESAMYDTGSANGAESFALEAPMPETETDQAVTSSESGAASGGSAPDESTADTGTAENGAPELPELCGSACSGLYWAEGELELPGIYFGGEQSISSDETGFTCTVPDCTEADFEDYVAELDSWYPAAEDTPDGTSAPGYPRVFSRLTAFGCQLRVEYAKDGTLSVHAENAE